MSMILTCSLKPSQHVLVPGICHCNTASLLHTFVRQLPRARKDDGEDALVLVCVYPETSPALFKTKQEKYVAQGKFKEKLSFTSSPSPPKLNCNAGILLFSQWELVSAIPTILTWKNEETCWSHPNFHDFQTKKRCFHLILPTFPYVFPLKMMRSPGFPFFSMIFLLSSPFSLIVPQVSLQIS